MPSNPLDTETRYRLLRLLEQNPELSQRELAAELGISLGKANYCLRALIDRGWIKMVNFGNSRNRTGYFYRLTPTGMVEKTKVARRFLARKLEEHERIAADIEILRGEVQAAHEETRAYSQRSKT
ncbi:MarR family EPS-associated transcriptional regulator [Halofilum ochraceum]|uniref:MarR family EPS-associated transcriptional regulator n=1 Tax=Halofilum ochraceum TaxID=1611323 RepID=UPI00082A70C8|nr:MarR family EPS-associated transcriptional regulator [Halofilum ochraceum]